MLNVNVTVNIFVIITVDCKLFIILMIQDPEHDYNSRPYVISINWIVVDIPNL